MGHAGAIVSAFGESAAEKVEILKDAGVTVAPHPSAMGETVAEVLGATRVRANDVEDPAVDEELAECRHPQSVDAAHRQSRL